MMFDLTGKVAYVAGGEGRIGKAIVKAFREQGAETYNIDMKGNADILTNIQCFVPIIPKLDIFVNTTYPGLGTAHLEIFYEATRNIINHMLINNSAGSIINMASIYGVIGRNESLYDDTNVKKTSIEYSMAKSSIIGMSRAFACKVGIYGIRVNCISPGGVEDRTMQNDVFIKKYSERTPLGRMAKPEDVAAAAVFLASDEASYITGQNLIVDGGFCSW